MKKYLFLTLAVIIGISFFLTYPGPDSKKYELYLTKSACAQPLAVKIGDIDPNYKLSKSEVKNDVTQAINIWNKSYGKEILVYDESAKLPINFVYDNRQNLIDQGQAASQQVDKLKQTLDQQQNTLNQQKGNLDPEYQQLQKDSQDFKQKLDQFNQEVDYWNKQGGASPQEYQKLKQEQADLKIQADDLNSRIQAFQQKAQNYNSQLNQFKQDAQQFNQEGSQLNQISQNISDAISQQPEEGIYESSADGQKIDIYFVVKQQELIHTLAHELGHALGLEHNEDKASIMYPFTDNVITPSKTDLADLTEVCRTKSILEVQAEKFKQVLDYYKSVLKIS
jgi:chromosome segregation ATPase